MIKGADGRIIVFDACVKQDTLYLISTYYSVDDKPTVIELNGPPLKEAGYKEYEPVRYFYGPAPAEATVTIHIDGVAHSITPERLEASPGEFAVATLFKYDCARIPDFVTYYRNQGCKKFYLYYNGRVLPESLPQAPDIVYRCWYFPYWNCRYDPYKCNTIFQHCAQMTFLTTIRHRYMKDYAWFGLVDLDEWVYTEGQTVVRSLQRESPDKNIIVVKNHWAFRDGPVLKYNPVGLTPCQRSKVFYRSTFGGECSIHYPKHSNFYVSGDLKLLHMADDLRDAGDSIPRQTRIDSLGPSPVVLSVADLLKT
jgi:hypothetical protein